MSALFIIIKTLNNFIYIIINYALNEIIYSFKIFKIFNIFNKEALP